MYVSATIPNPLVIRLVTLRPRPQIVSTAGASLRFNCSVSPPDGIVRIVWSVNSTSPTNDESVMIDFNEGEGTLLFTNLSLRHNSTRIRCIAIHEMGFHTFSFLSLLFVQGT